MCRVSYQIKTNSEHIVSKHTNTFRISSGSDILCFASQSILYSAFASTRVHRRFSLVGSLLVIFLAFCVVLFCVFTFSILYCDVRYYFRINDYSVRLYLQLLIEVIMSYLSYVCICV
jgi:hypothetical protein